MKKIENHFNWDEFIVKDLEKKHNLTSQAKTDGETDYPQSNSESSSQTEGELKNECYTFIEKHTNDLRNHLKNIEEEQNQLSGYLKQNHFEPIGSRLEADINTKINEKKIKLADYKNSYNTYNEEKNTFKRYHQIGREPNIATPIKMIIAFGIILSLLIIEVFANTYMLTPAMVGGSAEGLSVAGSVAFLNVFVSSLIGYYVVKNFNHIEKAKRSFYIFLGTIYFMSIFYINSCLGAYRSMAEKALEGFIKGSNSEQGQINEILRQSVTPWNVEFSFLGIVLTFIGISFAFIAIIDGLTFNDTYPNYGKVGQKVNEYDQLRKKTFHDYASEISSIFSNYNKELQNKLSELLNKDLNNWDANTNLIQKEFITYTSKTSDAEQKTAHMIKEYQKENQRVRKSDKPKYFGNKFSIDKSKMDPQLVFPDVAYHYMPDEQREKMKIEYSSTINKKFKECELNIEKLQKRTEEVQKDLHEKYSI